MSSACFVCLIAVIESQEERIERLDSILAMIRYVKIESQEERIERSDVGNVRTAGLYHVNLRKRELKVGREGGSAKALTKASGISGREN